MSDTAHLLVAAAIAEGIRRHRRWLVDEVAAGALAPEDLLVAGQGDPRIAQVKAVVLAEAVPGVGKVLSRRALAALGVPDGTRWGELTPTMAASVVASLRQAARERSARDGGA